MGIWKRVWRARRVTVRFNCIDLVLAGQWGAYQCCPTCHADSSIEETGGRKVGFPKDFRGRLCCRAMAQCMDKENPVDWEAVRRAVAQRKMMEAGNDKS